MRRPALLLAALLSSCATVHPLVGGRFEPALRRLDGHPFSWSETSGHVVLVDVWASWCRWCTRSIPFYARLQQDLGPNGLAYVGIDVDADPRAGRAFLKAVGSEQLVELEDREANAVVQRLNVERLPLLILIDRTARVRRVVQGFTAEDEAEIRRSVEALLAGG